MFYFRRAAMHRGSLPFHITMGNDAPAAPRTPSVLSPFAILVTYGIYWKIFQCDAVSRTII
jgi:hypothetical protein